MNTYLVYGIIVVILLALELLYFKIADKFNIIDKPNERSSHSSIVLRGGGIIFSVAMIVWAVMMSVQGDWQVVKSYLPFLSGLILVAGVSFWDDVKSLPDSVRLVAQFTAMALLFWNMGIMHWNMWWLVLIALILCVGITNVYNFMDGINGITAGYSLAVLAPLMLLNQGGVYVEESLVIVSIISVLVFCIFNFRPKGKAKCFAGDVGSICIAFIIVFVLGNVIIKTGDFTYLILLVVYIVDAVLTICHRVILHENIGQAHRKHAYQLMANELKIGHITISSIYMIMQLAISLTFIYLVPDTIVAHWLYSVSVFVFLSVVYILFKKKYYHLHEKYLASLN